MRLPPGEPCREGYVLSLSCPNTSQAWCEITRVSELLASPVLYRDLNSSITNLSVSTNTENKYNLYIGLVLAISSSIFIGSSFILKKRAFCNWPKRVSLELDKVDILTSRNGSGGQDYSQWEQERL